jgi:hypothetical protein
MSCPTVFYDENIRINISCTSYKAKTESLDFTEETCLYYSKVDDTYYARNCGIGKICMPKDKSLQSNYTCIPNLTPIPAYPGEACFKPSDCLSNICMNNICIGQLQNQPCKADEDCAPGLYCDEELTRACIPLLGLNNSCKRDAQCDYNYYCQILPGNSTGQCANYFNILDDEEVNTCISPSHFDYKCKSGSCADYNNGVYKCHQKYHRTYPTLNCTSDFNCIMPNIPYSSKCNCSQSPTGAAYCETLVGDYPYVYFNNYYRNWLISGNAKNCNTIRRVELACISKYSAEENYIGLVYFDHMIKYWDIIKDAEDEVIKTLYPDYWTAKINYELEVNTTCPSYKCKSDSQKFDDGTCGYYDKQDHTFYIDACDSGKNCTAGIHFDSNYTCIKDDKEPLAYPGEKCDNDRDCFSSSCINYKCKGIEEYEICDADTDCDPLLYCDLDGTKTCRALLPINSTCSRDWECDYGTFCYIPIGADDGNCSSYFNISSGTELNSCKGEVIDYQCKTGFCLIDDNDPVLGPIYTCSQIFSLKNDPKEPCRNDFDCIGFYEDEYESLLYSKCTCGYSKSGQAYCELLPGDELYAKYINYTMKWHESTEHKNCNTARRNTIECMEDYWDDETFSNLQYYMYKTLYWPKIQDVESCTKKVFATEYWEAKEENDESEDDFSFIIKYAALLALIILT